MRSASCCCHCCVPLQYSTQLVGVADFILGGLSAAALIIHVKEEHDFPDPPRHPKNATMTTTIPPSARPPRTFQFLDVMPVGFTTTVLVCHLVQMLMGVIVFIGAMKRKRAIIELYLVVTWFTALLTGFFIRIYEMIIVNDFSRELRKEMEKMERELVRSDSVHCELNIVQSQNHSNCASATLRVLSPMVNVNADRRESEESHNSLQHLQTCEFQLHYEPHNIPNSMQ